MQNSISERLEQVLPENFVHKSFETALKEDGLHPLRATGLDTLQINLGRLCNQACAHCHVKAGPGRTEIMEQARLWEFCLQGDKRERNRYGRHNRRSPGDEPRVSMVHQGLKRADWGQRAGVITRTNLTILVEDGFEEMPGFFAENGLEVVASLPCYTEETTDAQRGAGVYGASIEALKRLNAVGLRRNRTTARRCRSASSTTRLGPFHHRSQDSLEAAYRKELKETA